MNILSGFINSVACLNQTLFYHDEGKITDEMLHSAYHCPVDLIAHGGVPHRVLRKHDNEDRSEKFEVFQPQFMQNALLAALLASIACGIIGTLVVVNRIVFISGGIAHTAYGGIGLAFFWGLHRLPGRQDSRSRPQ